MKKKWIIFIIALVCVIILTPFIFGKMYHISIDNIPTSQKNTTWISEDKTIVFSVNENYDVAGYLYDDEHNKIEFFLTIGRDMNVHLYPISVLDEDYIRESERFEYWKCGYFLNEDKFVAKVEESMYFQKGERITFYKVTQDER